MSGLMKERVTDSSVSNVSYEAIQWHSSIEWLAVASYSTDRGGEISFFKQNGRKNVCSTLSNQNAKVTALNWHPKRCCISIGWSNGDVTLKDLQNNKEKLVRNDETSKKGVCTVLWHINESTLFVANQASQIFLYNIDDQLNVVGTNTEKISTNVLSAVSNPCVDTSSINDESSNTAAKQQSGFIYGCSSNGLYAVTEYNKPKKIFSTESPIVKLLSHKSTKMIICLTKDICLLQLSTTAKCEVEQLRKINFTGRWPNVDIVDAGDDEIFFCNNTKEIRIWKIKSGETETLLLRDDCGFGSSAVVNCISYSIKKGCLAGGTNDGKLAVWNRVEESADGARKWKLNNAYDIGGKIALIQFDSKNFLLVQLGTYILSHLSVQIQVRGIFVGQQHIVIWDREQVVIYEIVISNRAISTRACAGFRCNPTAAALNCDYVIVMEHDRISLRTFQGTVKQAISLPDCEGFPVILDVVTPWMCLGTSAGYLRIYELNNKEAVQRFNSKRINETIENFSSFVTAQINSDGNRVCFTYVQSNDDMVSANIVVWDAETDAIVKLDLATGTTDFQDTEQRQLSAEKQSLNSVIKNIDNDKGRFRLPDYVAGECQWDSEDPRVLVCEANHQNNSSDTNYLLTMFATSENGIQVHDIQERSPRADILIGVNIPLIYSTKKLDSNELNSDTEKCYGRFLLVERLGEFSGFQCTDKITKKAMINFSFYLTIGRIDEAFKEIKFIKSDKVWEHMALMCLKTRRLDVALTCLGNMGNACGARVVREAIESGEPQELQLAYLAIQLGLDDEALSLFKSCGRYDLINKFYQSKNDWNKAFEIAKDLDRIHLRNTHYHYAKNLEANDDIEGAIKHYEISHTNYEEVPRILINNSKKLESYIKKDQDPKMMKWWAQYLESHGDIDSALRFYRQASDYLSVVRLLCRDKKIEEARQLAESCNDNAACYHLARYYENTSDPKNAVHFFAKAHAYNSAIRIAKENRMTDQLANLALMAGESDMLEAARFYEQISGQTDKAVMLYHKGGMVGKAMELAFETQQLTALNLIAKDLNENSEPRILERAATFYAKTQQYTSAIKLLAYAKNYEAAIKFCTDYNVPLDESTAELLTPPKELINDTKKWCQMLQEIAKCCVIQGNYYSAAKKYTQAGNKIEAMRCLLKTGNTEKIIFFANTARNQDIYILAANYLQTLDWKSDENVLNNIVALYSRSNAFGHLAGFYEACAKAEIDDYRDYEKGYMALNEANRCLLKAIERNATEEERLQERCETLRKAIMDIKKFIQLQNSFDDDPFDTARQIEALLYSDNRCKYIQPGDFYAILVVHNVRTENYKKAYALVKELQHNEPGIDIKRYINPQILDEICFATGNPRLVTEETEEVDEEARSKTVDYSYALKNRLSSGIENVGD